MARLDQSFIKAYGHVGARATASHAGGAKPTSTGAASAALPLLSASPIIVDAGAFAIDAPLARACDAENAADRRDAETAVDQSAPPRPHFRRTAPVERKTREAPSADVAENTFPRGASAYSVDTFAVAGEAVHPTRSNASKTVTQRPTLAVRRPTTGPNAARPTTAAAPPQADRANFSHRACTVQFSTTVDVASNENKFDGREFDGGEFDDSEFESNDRNLDGRHDSRHAPGDELADGMAATAATSSTSPRVDGVAYHRMSARPASTVRCGYEVDAFRWPPIVSGLAGRATTALSTLVDELVDASSSGRGVVMFAGERRGAGTTTLAAYAARRLAELGLSVALVDADFAQPTLARSLGVAVDHGWDEALEAGSDFAAALIASLDDGVTVLPLRHPTTHVDGAKAAQIAADLAALRQHFALVVIDGGPLAEAEAWLDRAPEETVDCGIVVRDVRVDAGQRPGGRTHAPRAGALPAIGVVENFVGETRTTSK